MVCKICSVVHLECELAYLACHFSCHLGYTFWILVHFVKLISFACKSMFQFVKFTGMEQCNMLCDLWWNISEFILAIRCICEWFVTWWWYYVDVSEYHRYRREITQIKANWYDEQIFGIWFLICASDFCDMWNMKVTLVHFCPRKWFSFIFVICEIWSDFGSHKKYVKFFRLKFVKYLNHF